MVDRIALARAVDGQDLADALNEWSEETAANRLQWHRSILAALAPGSEGTVARSNATVVEDLSPRDPDEEDPALYAATVRLDALIEGPGEQAGQDVYEDVAIPMLVVATLGREPEGPVDVILHDVQPADEVEEP
jgi:hypothetical protein